MYLVENKITGKVYKMKSITVAESESSTPLGTEGYLLLMRGPIRRNRVSASAELPLTQTLNHLVETLPVVPQWKTTETAGGGVGDTRMCLLI